MLLLGYVASRAGNDEHPRRYRYRYRRAAPQKNEHCNMVFFTAGSHPGCFLVSVPSVLHPPRPPFISCWRPQPHNPTQQSNHGRQRSGRPAAAAAANRQWQCLTQERGVLDMRRDRHVPARWLRLRLHLLQSSRDEAGHRWPVQILQGILRGNAPVHMKVVGPSTSWWHRVRY